MFLFRKKKLVVDCFTQNPNLIGSADVKPAVRFIPEWWKATAKSYPANNPNNGLVFDSPTIKTCHGVIHLYKQGHILPMWSDLIIETDYDSYKWQYSELSSPDINQHDPKQWENSVNNLDHWLHAKLQSPWMMRSNKAVPFLCVEPTYTYIEKDYHIRALPGVLDFKRQHSMNVNMLLPKTIRRMKIDFGTPMYHFICLDSDYEVEFKSQYVGQHEWDKLFRYTSWRPFFRRNFAKICPYRE